MLFLSYIVLVFLGYKKYNYFKRTCHDWFKLYGDLKRWSIIRVLKGTDIGQSRTLVRCWNIYIGHWKADIGHWTTDIGPLKTYIDLLRTDMEQPKNYIGQLKVDIG